LGRSLLFHLVARGEKAAAAKLQEIAQLPIRVIDVDMELTRLAASLKAQHNLPYADCFGAALAQTRKATLLTSDKDFERVGSALKILWV
jgi:predicted nucleic acid-binding protein